MIARDLNIDDIVGVALRNHPCCDLRSCVCDTPCACGSDNECAYDNREHIAQTLGCPVPRDEAEASAVAEYMKTAEAESERVFNLCTTVIPRPARGEE